MFQHPGVKGSPIQSPIYADSSGSLPWPSECTLRLIFLNDIGRKASTYQIAAGPTASLLRKSSHCIKCMLINIEQTAHKQE